MIVGLYLARCVPRVRVVVTLCRLMTNTFLSQGALMTNRRTISACLYTAARHHIIATNWEWHEITRWMSLLTIVKAEDIYTFPGREWKKWTRFNSAKRYFTEFCFLPRNTV